MPPATPVDQSQFDHYRPSSVPPHGYGSCGLENTVIKASSVAAVGGANFRPRTLARLESGTDEN